MRIFTPANELPFAGHPLAGAAWHCLRAEGRASGSLTVHQGAEIGHPSRIDLSWTARDTVIGGRIADDGERTVSAQIGS